MQKIKRRAFIGKGAIGATAALVLSQSPLQSLASFLRDVSGDAAAYPDIPLGFQTWPIKDRLAKDFPGTLKTMAGMGYQLMELCSPAGYKDLGFGFLTNMKTTDILSTIHDAGLRCPSCHFGFGELTNSLDDRIDFARGLGLSQMICSTFGLSDTASLKDYQQAADKLNKAAEKIRAAGMVTGYHNHTMEFKQIDGQLIYDVLMAAFDPALVKMQFQTEVINLGYQASTYFTKYPGRFISSHLSDWSTDKKYVPIGQGVIDWATFFRTAKIGGVKNFFVEMPFETFKDSAAYIRSI